MDGEVILTADDIVRAGACREGVAIVLRRLAGTIAAAMPVSAILRLLAEPERELGYVTRAAQLDGDCYGWDHGGGGCYGYVHGGDGGGGDYYGVGAHGGGGYGGGGDGYGDGGGGDGYGDPDGGDGYGDGDGGDGYGDGYSYCAPE